MPKSIQENKLKFKVYEDPIGSDDWYWGSQGPFGPPGGKLKATRHQLAWLKNNNKS